MLIGFNYEWHTFFRLKKLYDRGMVPTNDWIEYCENFKKTLDKPARV